MRLNPESRAAQVLTGSDLSAVCPQTRTRCQPTVLAMWRSLGINDQCPEVRRNIGEPRLPSRTYGAARNLVRYHGALFLQ